MEFINIFENFATDFETAFQDDNWSRLEKYFAEDATYLNVGGPDQKVQGAAVIVEYLKKDVTKTDRQFDTRTLSALTQPTVNGNHLSRQWRCTYTLTGTPDLVVEGEARYLFEDDLIKEIEEEPTTTSMQNLNDWMLKYEDRLHA